MTQEQIKRAKQALTETRLLLNKELSYSEHLQNKDLVQFYKSHIVKLEKMIKGA